MERDDLRMVLHSVPEGTTSHWCTACSGTRPVSDADLASLGYVRLDGIDVEALIRRAIDAASEADGGLMPTEGTLKALWVGIPAALAVIDQQETTN